MPHCTADYPWYITKFALGLASIVFFYMGFLKEKESICVCGSRKRLWDKNINGEKQREDRCSCRKGFDNSVRYGCGCKRNIASEKVDEECIKERKPSIIVETGVTAAAKNSLWDIEERKKDKRMSNNDDCEGKISPFFGGVIHSRGANESSINDDKLSLNRNEGRNREDNIRMSDVVEEEEEKEEEKEDNDIRNSSNYFRGSCNKLSANYRGSLLRHVNFDEIFYPSRNRCIRSAAAAAALSKNSFEKNSTGMNRCRKDCRSNNFASCIDSVFNHQQNLGISLDAFWSNFERSTAQLSGIVRRAASGVYEISERMINRAMEKVFDRNGEEREHGKGENNNKRSRRRIREISSHLKDKKNELSSRAGSGMIEREDLLAAENMATNFRSSSLIISRAEENRPACSNDFDGSSSDRDCNAAETSNVEERKKLDRHRVDSASIGCTAKIRGKKKRYFVVPPPPAAISSGTSTPISSSSSSSFLMNSWRTTDEEEEEEEEEKRKKKSVVDREFSVAKNNENNKFMEEEKTSRNFESCDASETIKADGFRTGIEESVAKRYQSDRNRRRIDRGVKKSSAYSTNESKKKEAKENHFERIKSSEIFRFSDSTRLDYFDKELESSLETTPRSASAAAGGAGSRIPRLLQRVIPGSEKGLKNNYRIGNKSPVSPRREQRIMKGSTVSHHRGYNNNNSSRGYKSASFNRAATIFTCKY